MLEEALRIGVGVALDQIHQRVRAHVATSVLSSDLLDAAAGLLLILRILAAKQSRGAVLRHELPAALRGGRADDRWQILHGMGPGLAVIEVKILPVKRHAILGPQ